MSPGFEFKSREEMWWAHLRERFQSILQFDEESTLDTPRSEAIWSETCKQHDILRTLDSVNREQTEYPGPLGFTWWGWAHPTTVTLAPQTNGVFARLSISTELGEATPGSIQELTVTARELNISVPLGAMVIDPSGNAFLVFSMSLDASMLEEVVGFACAVITRQSAYATVVARNLSLSGLLTERKAPNAGLGVRNNPDEFVGMLLQGTESAIPFSGNGPASPEGASMGFFNSEEVAHMLADLAGWHYLSTLTSRSHRFSFTLGIEEDPRFWSYEIVDRPEIDRPKGLWEIFKPEPLLLVRTQLLLEEPQVYSNLEQCLVAANSKTWLTWKGGDHSLTGGFDVAQLPDGTFFVRGPVANWSAASLINPADNKSLATQCLHHLITHSFDQAKP